MNVLFLLGVLQLLAFHPILVWYARRMTPGTGDEYGWVALFTALAAVFYRQPPVHARPRLGLPVLLMLFYTAVFRYAPDEIRAALAFSAMGCFAYVARSWRVPPVAGIGLFLLALPALSSVQFYLGYPLRLAAAWLTVPLIRAAGLDAVRDGLSLCWEGQRITIDAPCSGVRMLWTTAYLVCVLSILCRLRFLRTLAAGLLALPLLVLANVLRAAALFYVETGIVPAPDAAHEAVGIGALVVLAAAVLAVVHLLAHGQPNRPPPARPSPRTSLEGQSPGAPPALAFTAVCLLAGWVSLTPGMPSSSPDSAFPGWPTKWEGRALQPLPLTTREERFASGFPGRIGRFSDGRRELILRWVTLPTRKLHPSADCFRGDGWRVKPAGLRLGPDGTAWGAFDATKETQRLMVREQYRDAEGRTWSDVSSWYWAAALGRSRGPWWVTVAVENPAPQKALAFPDNRP